VDVRIVKVEHRQVDDLLGVGETRPRLSWVTTTAVPGWRQAAHEIEVDGTSAGRVASGESVLVPWPAAPLAARERRTVRVRVWGTGDPTGTGTARVPDDGGGDGDGAGGRGTGDGAVGDGGDAPSGWSPPVTIEAGLLGPGDWTARFVGPAGDGPSDTIPPSPYLRRELTIDGEIAAARLYVTALGVYEVEINGQPVGDHVLAPGWTSYDHRLRVETFDVTDLLRPGANAIGALLGEGWYRGTLGWEGGRRNIYGDRLALLAQLEVVGADGAVQTFATDETWRSSTSPVVASGIYAGETYDARAEQPGWSSPGFDDGAWDGVEVVDRDLATLTTRVGPPVRRTEELRPVAITTSPTGRTVVDFGQNLVGRLRLRVPPGEAGTTITLRHAELVQDGDLCTEPLRLAEATDRYTLGGGAGGAATTWEPRFTFHGFRYAEVDGWPGGPGAQPTADDLTALVCHSDMPRTGWFACSDDRLNRLHENVVWGMRGNFLDVPTDCPQRDERLGWTGDIEVFAPTACFLHDAAGFLASWLADLAADQRDDGAVPFVVPNSLKFVIPAAAWGDAATIVPWVVHERTGDVGVLRTQYPSMRAWVDHVVAAAGENRLWDDGFQFGDWLDPHAPAKNPADARTDVHLVATAYLIRSLDIVAATAELLGEDGDAERYRGLAGEVRAAFAREYVTPNGRVASDSQTAYALALQFGLLPSGDEGGTEAALRDRAGRRLAELVERAGHTIATGFVGTPLVGDALCATGHADDAFRLLLQTKCPSWLYPVTMGATTIWERWDGVQPDGTLDPDAMRMNSFNHYALGAVGDWLHRSVAGLAPAAPGYRRLRIAPVVSRVEGAPTSASARHLTPYGPAEVAWRRDGETFELTAVVPPNTTATVVLPGREAAPIEVGAGTHSWTSDLDAPAAPGPTAVASAATP
jgi:alpha-L-rhamnosidase